MSDSPVTTWIMDAKNSSTTERVAYHNWMLRAVIYTLKYNKPYEEALKFSFAELLPGDQIAVRGLASRIPAEVYAFGVGLRELILPGTPTAHD